MIRPAANTILFMPVKKKKSPIYFFVNYVFFFFNSLQNQAVKRVNSRLQAPDQPYFPRVEPMDTSAPRLVTSITPGDPQPFPFFLHFDSLGLKCLTGS